MPISIQIADTNAATKLIRKHPNPEIRNVLIIAMTASAIQGDREKCLDSGKLLINLIVEKEKSANC